MRRREFLTSGITVGTLAAIPGCLDSGSGSFPGFGGDGTPTETYSNPVFEPVFADPTAVRAPDGTYYAYATQDKWCDGEGWRYVPILESTDLITWESVGDAFAKPPDWKEEGFLWAPDIVRMNDTYYCYYSYSQWGDDNPGIGVATSKDPTGQFTDHGKLFLSKEIGVPNSIDPMVFLDGETPYLFWGSHHGIYAVELTSDGFDVTDQKTRIAGNAFEGAYVLKRDGSYYFFGSVGTCCEGLSSTYHVRVGKSSSLLGPYTDPGGNSLLSHRGSLVVESGNGFVGPGHNAIVTDDAGDYWMLYHGYEEGQGYICGNIPRRTLLLDRLQWRDGWPRVRNRVPSPETHVPQIN